MKSEEFKEFLKEDATRIEKVLESVGCHGIWRAGREDIRACAPNGTNNTAVSVNTETLYCRYYHSGETIRADIIGLVEHFRNESFVPTFRFLKSLFGLSGNYKKENKIDPLSKLKGLRKGNRAVVDIKERDIPKFGMEVLSDFIMLPHVNLFYEGITPQTAKIFNICYDENQDRIIFPHFSYDDKNAIVGVTGRTLRSEEELKAFKIAKYWNYVKGYMKTWGLFGFSHGIDNIIKNKMIIIAEGEKSVLKHWSMTRNEGFTVSVGCHEISQEQVQIILQNTPSDVEVVIAFDKDVIDMKDENTGESIGEQYLIKQCEKFSKFRKTSYIFDTYNVLNEKSSPFDQGVKLFNHLLKYRKQV